MQLDLFKWSSHQDRLTDLGGRCSYCLETENWLITAIDGDETYLECQTVDSYDDGALAGLCLATKSVTADE